MKSNKTTHLNLDGSLRVVRFADVDEAERLIVDTRPRPLQMANSDATGEPILSNGTFGCDVIRFGKGEGVQAHTHEGNHILLVLRGHGRVIFDGEPYRLAPGLAYLIEGAIIHAIEADTELVLMAIGDKHFPVNSEERMTPAHA